MVTTIELDEATAASLTARAESLGLSLGAYLRRLAEASAPTGPNGSVSLAEFDRHLDDLAADLPPAAVLPSDFSRSDIYSDHD